MTGKLSPIIPTISVEIPEIVSPIAENNEASKNPGVYAVGLLKFYSY